MLKRILILCLCAAFALPMVSEHPWKGKRVAYFGDSITDPNNVTARKHYWNYLQEWYGVTPYVYAISGKQWDDIPRQAEALEKEHGHDVDAILIFIGTNDFNAAVPVGEWFETDSCRVEAAVHRPRAMETRLHRTPVMTTDTYRGRINRALDDVKRRFPEKQIILLTPLHRAYANFGDRNIQPDESYQNACGEWIDAYVESVVEAGRIWALPVIDLNQDTGLYPLMDEMMPYFGSKEKDRLHPNDAGHVRLAKTLWQRLSVYPIF